jgi:hypothetical protein
MRRLTMTSASGCFPATRVSRGGQPADHADARCGQHLVQPAEDRLWRQLTIGPILLGAAQPVHILTSTATVRRIVNMTALTVVDKLMNER